MEYLDTNNLKQTYGGKTDNHDEFFEWGRQFGRATREALATVGMFFLLLK